MNERASISSDLGNFKKTTAAALSLVILWGLKKARVCLPQSYMPLPPSVFGAIVDCFVSISLLGKFRIYCRCLATECRLGSAATAGWELGWRGVGERVGWSGQTSRVMDRNNFAVQRSSEKEHKLRLSSIDNAEWVDVQFHSSRE